VEISWLCEDAIGGVVIDSLLGGLCRRPVVLKFDRRDVADRGEKPAVVPPVNPAERGQFNVIDVAPRALHGDQFCFELIYRQGPWRGLDDVEFATLTYVDWFNHHRLHGEITADASYSTPADHEAVYYRGYWVSTSWLVGRSLSA
jgi:hypothetical protein